MAAFEKAWSPTRKGERDLSRRLHAVLTTQYTRASVGDTFDDNHPPPTFSNPPLSPPTVPERIREEDGDNGEVADCVSIHPSRRFPLSIMINFEFPIYSLLLMDRGVEWTFFRVTTNVSQYRMRRDTWTIRDCPEKLCAWWTYLVVFVPFLYIMAPFRLRGP